MGWEGVDTEGNVRSDRGEGQRSVAERFSFWRGGVGTRHLKKRAGASLLSHQHDGNPQGLFQLNLDNLERFLARIFRQVSKGIHVLHRASLRLDVLTLPIRVNTPLSCPVELATESDI